MKMPVRIVFLMLGLIFTIQIISSQEVDKLEIISAQNISRLEQLDIIDQFPDSLKSIVFSPDNTSITMVLDSKIISMDILDNKQEELANVDKFVSTAVISDDNRLFGCVCSNQSPINDFHLMDLETGDELLSLVNFGPVFDIAIDAQNEYVVIASGWTRESSKVQIWDIEQQNMMLELPHNGWIWQVAFSPNSQYVAAAFISEAQIWDLDTLSEVFSIEQPFKISEQGSVGLKIGDMAFSPDNNQVASMSPEGFIWIWDTSSGEMLASFHDVSIAYDNTQSLYSLSNTHIKYSPDGKLIVTSNGQSLNIWDIATETLIYDVEGITNFMFSGDGRILMTVDVNNTVTLWGVTI